MERVAYIHDTKDVVVLRFFNKYEVRIDAPGYDREDIKIDVEDGILNIKGEKKNETNEDGKSYLKRERIYSSFEKNINLNEDIAFNDIKASLKNGVLELSLPKKEVKKISSKKITVE